MKNKIFLTSALAMLVACPAVSAPANGYIGPGDTSADCTSPDPLIYDGHEYDSGYYTLRADWAEDECVIKLDPNGGDGGAEPSALYTRFDDGAYLMKNGNVLVDRMYPRDDPTYPDGMNGLYDAPQGPVVTVSWNTNAPTNNFTGNQYSVTPVNSEQMHRPFNGFWADANSGFGGGVQYIYNKEVDPPFVLTESGAQRAADIAKDTNGECPTEIWYAGYGCASGFSLKPLPSLAGYTPLGWYSHPQRGQKVTSVPSLCADTTYYVHWQANQYNVTYSCPSEVDHVQYNMTLTPPFGKDNPDKVTFNSEYTMWDSATACVGDGVECSGWVCTRTDGKAFSEPSTTGGYWQNASNVSCVAVCGSNEVNLIWNYNDNVSEDGQTSCQYGTTGTINVPQPIRRGYTFRGWTVVNWSDRANEEIHSGQSGNGRQP